MILSEGKRGVLSCHNSALTAGQYLCLSQRSDQTSNLIIFLHGAGEEQLVVMMNFQLSSGE